MTTSPEPKSLSVDPGRLRLDDAAGTTGTLLGMRCQECSIYVFGHATFCQACTSDKLESVDLSLTGTLYSYTIVRVPPSGWPGPVPYVLGEVELPEGPHVLAEVVGISEAQLKIGMDVELALQEVRSGEAEHARIVYKWAPLDRSEEAGEEALP